MKNYTEADKKFAETFIEEYNFKSKKFINALPKTYSRIVQINNNKLRLISFLNYFQNQELKIAEAKQKIHGKEFKYSRKIESYAKDGKTIAYIELTDLINPYESKVNSYEFINLGKKNLLEELQNKMIDIYAAAQKYEPDKQSSQGTFIEEVLIDPEFVMDIFSNLKNCEKLFPKYLEKIKF